MKRSVAQVVEEKGAALFTADDILKLGDIGRCELLEGRLTMMSPAGARHGRVAMRIGRRLAQHVEAKALGEVSAAETGFVIERNPDTVRAPDVGFVAASRIPSSGAPDSFWPFAPDLAVEVVSPSDGWAEVVRKAHAWLNAGTTLVWIVDPETRTVHVYRKSHDVRELTDDGVLDGGDVVPGFAVPVRELFG